MMAVSPDAQRGAIARQRQIIRSLLVPGDPGDAMTAYYALDYDPRRVRLTLHHTPSGQTDGFAAVCQTGQDLFVPLVVLRAPEGVVGELLHQALKPGPLYSVVTTPGLRGPVLRTLRTEWQQLNSIYTFEPSTYRPLINVMVQPGAGPFRFEIRVRDRVACAAGVNWHSDRLADMYVYTEPGFEGRGWAKAVGAACVKALLEAGLLPMYTVAQGNTASQRLARALGFEDSGEREFECRGYLRVQ